MNRPPVPSGRFIDLSRPIENGIPMTPGLPAPRIEPFLSHAASRTRYGGLAEFEISRLFLVGNTGTSIDSPYHRDPGEPDVSDLPLDSLVGLPGLCLDGRVDRSRGVAVDLTDVDPAERAILVRTGWDVRFGTEPYWRRGPYLPDGLVDRLIDGGAALVGVDFANVDDVDDLSRPAHTRLLRAGILVVEHLVGLDRLPRTGFRFFAPVLAVRGAAALPVRAFAEVEEPAGEI
ncbi:MAG TPA: cyclase family protein [Candidatus Limnocylindrales bacterium]|nr:cyclase family protein [Candidatus Limnocylindrales bacterium]